MVGLTKGVQMDVDKRSICGSKRVRVDSNMKTGKNGSIHETPKNGKREQKLSARANCGKMGGVGQPKWGKDPYLNRGSLD